MRPPLPPRRREALLLTACGLTPREVAARMTVSSHTVSKHLEIAYRELGAHTAAHALTVALVSGLVSVEELRRTMEALG